VTAGQQEKPPSCPGGFVMVAAPTRQALFSPQQPGADLAKLCADPDHQASETDRREQEDLPGRPEAIRRLVELGLKAKPK
jgi:hypothetical protein